MTTPREVTVTGCAECPWSADPQEMAMFNCLTCTATGAQLFGIERSPYEKIDDTPPAWCPLREAPTIVRLNVR